MMARFRLLAFCGLLGMGGIIAATCDPTHPNNNFCLASAGANTVLDGIYISPYTAYVDGSAVQTAVICNDFLDDVQVGESWQATSAAVGSLNTTGLFGSLSSNGYKEVAWLTEQLLLPSNLGNAGSLSYAIWSVFNPSSVDAWLSSYHDTTTRNAVASWLSLAASHTSDNFSNVSVYTPVSGTQTCCGRPQEFMVVKTPEGSGIGMLAIDLSCLGAAVLVVRRKVLAMS